LTKRKGIDQVLDAIALSPAQTCENLCLLMVGPLGAGVADKERLNTRISDLRTTSKAQIIVCDEFVADKDVQPYFQLSDFVLATYQKHVGMSNILIRAALAQKPVISSNYGLMGEVTRRFGLGLTVNSARPTEIALALTRCMTDKTEPLCNLIDTEQFGKQNSAERFSQVIFQHLLKSAQKA
ncbi:MAG: glycosyltransferase, partial [Leptolyngbya sp. SIO4C1]|nr:glycosyltransferase [Leptolyngbya sp. SIO4C1]